MAYSNSNPHRHQPLRDINVEDLQASVQETLRNMNASIDAAKDNLFSLRQNNARHSDLIKNINDVILRGDMPLPVEKAIQQQQEAMHAQFHTDTHPDSTRSSRKPHRRRRGIPA